MIDPRSSGSFLKGRWFSSTSRSAMARLSSARPQRCRLRSRARIQRWSSFTGLRPWAWRKSRTACCAAPEATIAVEVTHPFHPCKGQAHTSFGKDSPCVRRACEVPQLHDGRGITAGSYKLRPPNASRIPRPASRRATQGQQYASSCSFSGRPRYRRSSGLLQSTQSTRATGR